jgi:hypothetical protein
MRRVFLESPSFTEELRKLRVPDALLRELQADIMQGLGDMIPGSGGLKKIRWATAEGGKRGGRRVLFADYQEFGLAILLTIYAKNVKENLTPAEMNDWKALKHQLDIWVRVKYGY